MKYLSRSGQTFGPFSDDEIDSMKRKGELFNYSWIREAEATQWQPLDPPPAAPVIENQRAEAPAPQTCSDYKMRIEAICHDFHHVVSGTLEAMNDSGCELVSPVSSDFKQRSAVILSLHDPASGRSMNLRARLTEASRKNGLWSYRLKWARCPEIITS